MKSMLSKSVLGLCFAAISVGTLAQTTKKGTSDVAFQAEIMADMANALAPKENKGVTIVGARAEGPMFILELEIEVEDASEISQDEFKTILPILNKALKRSYCANQSQRSFIDSGGMIGHDMLVKGTDTKVNLKVEDCEGY